MPARCLESPSLHGGCAREREGKGKRERERERVRSQPFKKRPDWRSQARAREGFENALLLFQSVKQTRAPPSFKMTSQPSKVVALTGGTGYLGQWIIAELLAGGWSVRDGGRGALPMPPPPRPFPPAPGGPQQGTPSTPTLPARAREVPTGHARTALPARPGATHIRSHPHPPLPVA